MKQPLAAIYAASLVCGLAAPARAADGVEAIAAKFGARNNIRDISISPKGDQIVIVAARPAGGENSLVINLETGGAVSIFGAKGKNEQVGWCDFVLEERVVCLAYFREGSGSHVERATRLATISSDGKEAKLLSARESSRAFYTSRFGGEIIDYNAPGNPNAVLMTRWYAEEKRTGSMVGRSSFGLGVEAVDLVSLTRKPLESPRETAIEFLTDGEGHVRLMESEKQDVNGYGKAEITYSYRPVEGDWKRLGNMTIDGGQVVGFRPVAVSSEENAVYGFDGKDGYTALYKMALDGSGQETLVLSRTDVDVDGLVRIGRNQRIVGASYATDRRKIDYFDPELKSLATGLANALGSDKQVFIIDASADESKLLVFAGSDVDPGHYYVFDKSNGHLSQLLSARPGLAGVKLGEMKPIEYPASDGTMIPAYLTLPPGSDGKNLPTIVMPHGGPSARDEWGFDWLVQFFAVSGYAVLQPNFRGSSGFGQAWFQKNGFRSWKTAVGDIDDAGRWLENQGIAAPGKLAIFGWSYGGYAALQSQVVDPDLFKAVVAVAPVTDLERLREEFRDQPDFRLIEDEIGNGPQIEEGSPARHADRFKAPVLLFHGDADTNVGVGESRLMRDRLKDAGKQVTYVEFKNLAHQLDDAEARTKLLSESDTFLRKALGLK